jgi:ferredoxin
LTPIADFENAETFGVEKVEEYSWKQLLDMAACLECGRCTLNCPTVNTGKALNPKHLVVEQREHLLAKTSFLWAQMAKFSAARAAGATAEQIAALDEPLTRGEGGDVALDELITRARPLMAVVAGNGHARPPPRSATAAAGTGTTAWCATRAGSPTPT